MNDINPGGRIDELRTVGRQDVKADVSRPVRQMCQPVGRGSYNLCSDQSQEWFKLDGNAQSRRNRQGKTGLLSTWESSDPADPFEYNMTYPWRPPAIDNVSTVSYVFHTAQTEWRTYLLSTPCSRTCQYFVRNIAQLVVSPRLYSDGERASRSR